MLEVVAVVAGIILLSMGLALVERRRRSTPLVFRCRRCTAEFRQPPHAPYPQACPHCRARAWAT